MKKTFLTCLECPLSFNQVINIREWTFSPRDRNHPANNSTTLSTPTPTPPPSSSPNNNNDKQIPTQPLDLTLAVKFFSNSVRDFVMSHKARMRGKTVKDIFDQDFDTPVYMDSLSSSAFHILCFKARFLAKKFDLPGPRIQGNTVLMRLSASARPSCINSIEDLQALETKLSNSPPSTVSPSGTTLS